MHGCAGAERAVNVPSNPRTDSIDRRQIGTLLRVPWQRANLEVNAALRAAGHATIQPAHQLVVQHLPTDGARLPELARFTQTPEATLTALVNDLVAHGYLTYDEPHGLVRRAAPGWEVERVARETLQRLEDEWSERMGLERFADLCALLAYLATVIDAGSEPT